jgi:hypothetical protein
VDACYNELPDRKENARNSEIVDLFDLSTESNKSTHLERRTNGRILKADFQKHRLDTAAFFTEP